MVAPYRTSKCLSLYYPYNYIWLKGFKQKLVSNHKAQKMSKFVFWLRFRKNLSLAQFLTLCTFLELCYKLVSHSSHFVLSLSFVTTRCFAFGFVLNFATIVCCNFSFELWTLCFCWLVICASKEVFFWIF